MSPQKIKKIIYVEATGKAENLTKEVQSKLDEGWQLHGNVVIAAGNGDSNANDFYVQAMVQYDDNVYVHAGCLNFEGQIVSNLCLGQILLSFPQATLMFQNLAPVITDVIFFGRIFIISGIYSKVTVVLL